MHWPIFKGRNNIFLDNWSLNMRSPHPRCTDLGRQATWAAEFCTMMSNCRSFVYSMFFSPFWCLEFWGGPWSLGKYVHNCTIKTPNAMQRTLSERAQYQRWIWVFYWILPRKYETLTTELSTKFGKFAYVFVKGWEFSRLNYKNRFYGLIHSEVSSSNFLVQVCSSPLLS